MVERNKEYVQAARVIGVPPLRIMLRHVLPNVMGPVLVLSTIQVATAILAEATLSFLGVGVLADLALARHLHQRGQQAAVQRRLVAGDLPGRDAGADRAQHQPVRRLAARRAEPAPALTLEAHAASTRSRSCVPSPSPGTSPPPSSASSRSPACASTDYHYSQLSGKRYYRAPIDTYAGLDRPRRRQGQRVHAPGRSVDPGLRKVMVQGPPGGAGGLGEQRDDRARASRPCTRYYLVAVQSQPARLRLRRSASTTRSRSAAARRRTRS